MIVESFVFLLSFSIFLWYDLNFNGNVSSQRFWSSCGIGSSNTHTHTLEKALI